MEYVIEKGIPAPDLSSKHVWRRSREVDPMWKVIAAMEPGDSFLTDKTLQAISLASAKTKTAVASRKEGSFYRVWRTS